MEFRIIKANLQFRERLQPLNLAKVDGIALHHMAHPTWTIEDVHRSHLARGWAGCGYNYWVAKDGTIYEARGLHVGAGIAGHNSHLIHIGFQGDYERVDRTMPDAQFNAGVWLIQYLRQRVPTVRVVNGHRHWAATACPGRFFPLAQMLQAVAEHAEKAHRVVTASAPDSDAVEKTIREVQAVSRLLRKGDRGNDVRAVQEALKLLGYDPGPIDGIFGPRTDAAVRAFQRAKGLGVDGIVGPKTRAALVNALGALKKKIEGLIQVLK